MRYLTLFLTGAQLSAAACSVIAAFRGDTTLAIYFVLLAILSTLAAMRVDAMPAPAEDGPLQGFGSTCGDAIARHVERSADHAR